MKPLLATVCGLVGGLLGVVMVIAWGIPFQAQPEPSREPAGSDQELVSEMRAIVRELNRVVTQLKRMSLPALEVGGKGERELVEGQYSNLAAEMREALNRLRETVETARASASPRQTFGQSANVTPRKLRDLWQTPEEARSALFFGTYTDVLRRLGWPKKVLSGGGLSVIWTYPDGTVSFLDGLVAEVHMKGE